MNKIANWGIENVWRGIYTLVTSSGKFPKKFSQNFFFYVRQNFPKAPSLADDPLNTMTEILSLMERNNKL